MQTGLFMVVLAEIFAIFLSLTARLAAVAVAVPIFMLSRWKKYRRDVIPIMTWGGLKGGISVALLVPGNEYKPLILTVTYIVVLFSIIVQGLTIAPLAKKLDREQEFL